MARSARVSGVPKKRTKRAGCDLSPEEKIFVLVTESQSLKLVRQWRYLDCCHGRVAPRSRMAAGKHVEIGAGVIDKDYCG